MDSVMWFIALNDLCSQYDMTARAVRDGWRQAQYEPKQFTAYRLDIQQRLPLFYARWTAAYLKARLTK